MGRKVASGGDVLTRTQSARGPLLPQTPAAAALDLRSASVLCPSHVSKCLSPNTADPPTAPFQR